MRILITDGMDKAAMAQLRELGHEVVEQFYEPDQLGAALRDFDAVVVRSKTKVRANHIDEAKGGKLKLIIRGGVGVDNIDVKYAEENGIAVRNTPGASSQSVAELAMGHMFACTRYISIAGHTMREGKWEKKAYGKGIELQGKALGIIGFGRIGQHLGVMAKAIGMNVVAYSTTRRPEVEAKFGIPYVTLEELLAQSDFISLHAPAAPGAPLINADTIAKMKDGVVIINTSRGANVDEDALLRQLDAAGCPDRAKLPFQKAILNKELPYTIGGGIGQSRICMFFLRKAHIGEVHVSLWPKEITDAAEAHGLQLL